VLVLLALGGLMQAAGSFAPDTAIELAFGYLLLTAFFAGSLSARVALPRLTGYIIAGLVVGPSALALVNRGVVGELRMVGDVATALIALHGGAELDLKQVRPLLTSIRSIVWWAIVGAMFVLTFAILALRPLVPFLGQMEMVHALAVSSVIAVALAAQSPAVVMALIGETRSDGVVTRTVLAVVVIADLVVVVAYGVASSVASAVISGQADIAGTASEIAWEVFGSAGIGIFIGACVAAFLLKVPRGTGLFILMVCLSVAQVGLAVHLDPLIIMLTAGIWIQNVSKADAHELIENFDAASLPVYLVFFALASSSRCWVRCSSRWASSRWSGLACSSPACGSLPAAAAPIGRSRATPGSVFFLRPGSRWRSPTCSAGPFRTSGRRPSRSCSVWSASIS